jgi:hypothetical protein
MKVGELPQVRSNFNRLQEGNLYEVELGRDAFALLSEFRLAIHLRTWHHKIIVI